MGELHLDIIKDRILKEYKVEVDFGRLQIAYREIPFHKLTDTQNIETKISSSKQSITVKLTVEPVEPPTKMKDVLKLDKSPEYASNIASIFPKHLVAVKQGIEVGLAHGPKISCPVVNTQVTLHLLQLGKGTSDTVIAATVTQLVQKMLREIGTSIMEPIMNLEIVTPAEHLSIVMADLTRRRAIISNVGVRGNSKLVISKAPLSELKGYSTILRTLSSGTATFTMELGEYVKMAPAMESIAIKNVRGF
ncbi:unnamed protein product [Psylliodes chrysocephalus]|uniref:Elongation factor EFG domain-containing protein n=1 Tax=Psylliodes chrysocephalus TaxID=3402493 RepID=A0A9P0CH08_9CUCU|nr:unnamed protein product [Psylliodes chrysocephala]